MKKILACLLAALLVLSMTACGNAAPDQGTKETYVVGVCQLMPHPALDEATRGFVDKLKEELGDQVEIRVNVAVDANTCPPIVNAFVSDGVDLIMANATSALQAATAATADIPILGTSVTEYGVALGIPDFNGTVGGNVSGTSDLARLDQQAQMVKDWFPEAKTVGLLFCSGEPNSKYQVDTVKAYLEEMGFSCTLYSFADTNDMAAVTQAAADNSDVLYIPTDNQVANAAGIVDGICRAAGVPAIVGEQGICSGCGVAALSISYYDLGVKTGEMAAQILRGEADISEMPVSYTDNFARVYNPEICKALGITPLDGYEPIA